MLSELIRLNPNGFRTDRLPPPLADVNPAEIDEAVLALQRGGIVRATPLTNERTGRQYTVVELAMPQQYPIQETLLINGREYPRMLAGDIASGEDMNLYMQVMGDIEKRAREETESVSRRLRREYWITTGGLLSVFMSVFALILRTSEPFDLGGRSAGQVFLLKSAEVAPLAIVLSLFVLATFLASRR